MRLINFPGRSDRPPDERVSNGRPIFAAAYPENRLQAKSDRQALRLETGSFRPEPHRAGLWRVITAQLKIGVQESKTS
jgi:hypothetical protein